MLPFIRLLEFISRLVKRTLKGLFWLLLIITVSTTIVIQGFSGDADFTYSPPATLVNDVTRINPIHVARVVRPDSVEEVVAAIRASNGPISIGGGRYSQGGQIAHPDSLHFDMRSLNDVVNLDISNRRITVESGITWRRIQEFIDPHDLSVKIMQTYSNFTVGGSLSVNVHGRYIGEGPLVRSVETIKMVLADGSLITASPQQNAEIFYGAIGGYGGLGIIVEATLQLADNTRVERRTKRMALTEYVQHFRDNVRDDADVVFHNADLYPPDYDELLDVSWYRTDKPVNIEERLRSVGENYFWQPLAAGLVATLKTGPGIREFVIDPLVYARNRVVWRNWEASYDVAELEPRSRKKHTYVLREYFVPVGRLESFVEKMGDIFRRHDAEILNVSIRHALPDPGTMLAWAREEVFALVVYYRQQTNREARTAVAGWSREMIDAVIAEGGTYYLPYQIFATPEQFASAYPRSTEFFALKKQLDPDNRFRNRLWQQHYPENRQALDAAKAGINDYTRGEEQTLLTVPEWYLVFNPLEYADFLQAGNDPNSFPFFASIDEFWTLYDRVRVIAEAEAYPPNSEYLTMLRVIGISTTVEFMMKGAYENSMGRFTRWTADGEDTPEDVIIAEAHRAYSDLIFNEAWYEFEFGRWIGRIWRETDFLGENFARKLERKLFFTMEFGFKEIYARLIGAASKATYGEQAQHIYFTATGPGGPDILPAPVNHVASEEGQHLMSVQRWGPFTENLPKLANAGFDFDDISGNSRIVVSLVADKNNRGGELPGALLFTSRVLSDSDRHRLVMMVSVNDLKELIQAINEPALRLEHIYDY